MGLENGEVNFWTRNVDRDGGIIGGGNFPKIGSLIGEWCEAWKGSKKITYLGERLICEKGNVFYVYMGKLAIGDDVYRLTGSMGVGRKY